MYYHRLRIAIFFASNVVKVDPNKYTNKQQYPDRTMPSAWKVDECCPNCNEDSDVWLFQKEEGTGTKDCYTCESCGWEWSKMRLDN